VTLDVVLDLRGSDLVTLDVVLDLRGSDLVTLDVVLDLRGSDLVTLDVVLNGEASDHVTLDLAEILIFVRHPSHFLSVPGGWWSRLPNLAQDHRALSSLAGLSAT
jgi:hypothetical protein